MNNRTGLIALYVAINHAFPGYARIRRIVLLSEPWSTDNGLLTPTLKLKRSKVPEHCQKDFSALFDGH